MFFFILQSLFWFLLSLFAGFFLGRWLKDILCQHNEQKKYSKHIDTDDTTPEDDTTIYRKPTGTESASNAYDAMIKKSQDSSNFNAKNVAAGTTTAALATAAYSARSAFTTEGEKSSASSGLEKPSHQSATPSSIFNKETVTKKADMTPTPEVTIDGVDTKYLVNEKTNEKIVTNNTIDADTTRLITPKHRKNPSIKTDNTDQTVEKDNSISTVTSTLGTIAAAGAINVTTETPNTESKTASIKTEVEEAIGIQPLLSDDNEKIVTTENEDDDHTVLYTTTRTSENKDTPTPNTDTKIDTETVTPSNETQRPKNEESLEDHSETTLISDDSKNNTDSTTTATLGTLATGAISAATLAATNTKDEIASTKAEETEEAISTHSQLSDDSEKIVTTKNEVDAGDNTVLYTTPKTLEELEKKDTLNPKTDAKIVPTKPSVSDETPLPKNKEDLEDNSVTTLTSDSSEKSDNPTKKETSSSTTTATLGALATGAISAATLAATNTKDKIATTKNEVDVGDNTVLYTTPRTLEEAENKDTLNLNTDAKADAEITPTKPSVSDGIPLPQNKESSEDNSATTLTNDSGEKSDSPTKEETLSSTTTATLGTLAAGAISAATLAATNTKDKIASTKTEIEEAISTHSQLSDDNEKIVTTKDEVDVGDSTVLYTTPRTLEEAKNKDTLNLNTDAKANGEIAPTKPSASDETPPQKNKESSDSSIATLISNSSDNSSNHNDTKIDTSTTDTSITSKNNSDTNEDNSNTALGIATGIAGATNIIATTASTNTDEEETPIDTTGFDNLQVIEGIGDTMESILYNNGIGTWKKLSLQSNSNLRALLDQEGDKYKGVKTEGWIEQAQLAANGKFADLAHLQKQDGKSKVLKKFSYLLDKTTVSHNTEDDLKKVIGIGSKVMELLNNAGIYTFKELSNTSIEHLQKILDDGGKNFHITNPKTWPEQAQLADQQEWEKLQQYKGHLN